MLPLDCLLPSPLILVFLYLHASSVGSRAGSGTPPKASEYLISMRIITGGVLRVNFLCMRSWMGAPRSDRACGHGGTIKIGFHVDVRARACARGSRLI